MIYRINIKPSQFIQNENARIVIWGDDYIYIVLR